MPKSNYHQDYYELLRVSRSATSEEIRDSYREIAKIYHPDSNFYDEILGSMPSDMMPSDSQGMEKFKTITMAYNTLLSPEKRSEYDSTLPPLVEGNFYKAGDGSAGIINRFDSGESTQFFSLKKDTSRTKPQANGTTMMARENLGGFGQTNSKLLRSLSVPMESIGDMLGIKHVVRRNTSPLGGLSPLTLLIGGVGSMIAGAVFVLVLRFLF